MRKNSVAIGGGAFGDEGKGRLVDKYVSEFSKTSKVVVYRDNGGANAGHTVEFDNGQRVALHQLPSGVFVKNSAIVLGKNMVLHPGDLREEINMVSKVKNNHKHTSIMIDEMATLCLDTHRAYEQVLKSFMEGSKGSTGRGIAPAYADILYRHPLKIRDISIFNEEKIRKHYRLYQSLLNGLGFKLSAIEVPSLNRNNILVGNERLFIKRLKSQSDFIKKYIFNTYDFISDAWEDIKYSFVFEKAQGFGLDVRWGIYPDVTASDTTFSGIYSSTEGVIDPNLIPFRIAVIKATYMSSVGARVLPTKMEEYTAEIIRQDAHEYGATTKRPRDIAYIDIPALRYLNKVGQATHLALTHMDIVYPDIPIKVCVDYKIGRKSVTYRPDQAYLNTVIPVYQEFKPWNKADIVNVKKVTDLPASAKTYLKFISKEIGLPIISITMGPKRNQGIFSKTSLL